MSEMTYTRCPLCYGDLRGPEGTIASSCVCVRGETPGYAATGLTLGQIERMVLTERCLSGDPGVPAGERWWELVRLRERLEEAEVRESI